MICVGIDVAKDKHDCFILLLIATQVYSKGIDKAITITTKELETNEANVTMAENKK